MGVDTDGKPAPVYSIEARPVYGGSEENKKFFRATPGGEMKLYVLSKEAGEYFEPGDEVIVTFEKVEKPTA